MQKPSTLFTGIFGAFAVSCGAMVLIPHSQIGGLQPQVQWEEGKISPDDVYPQKRNLAGEAVYVEYGCFYCHTQQVRDPQYGPDMERGWGVRRTVARDYIHETVPLLGSTRLGPDFANYGSPTWRNEHENDLKKPAKRDAQWIYRHLFNPKTLISDSKCPPYRSLFERKLIGEKPSPNAAASDGTFEFIPTLEAEHLAKYLLSQDRSHEVKEAPIVIKPKEVAKK
jgi:cytochrome c oxidase cbb3-type subunit 2